MLVGAGAGAAAVVAGEAPASAGTLSNQSDSGATEQSGADATEIASCTVIDEPGRYELTADLQGSGEVCVHVRADDVVVDGNGHVVRGEEPANNSAGVLVHNGSATDIEQTATEPENVTVRDLRATGWTNGVRTGEFVSDGPAVTLRNVSAANNTAGFVLFGAGESTLTELAATGNEQSGIYLWESTGVNASRLDVGDNGGPGLHLDQAVVASNFTDVVATGNGGHGVVVGQSAVDNRITDVYAADNGGAGVAFSDSARTHLHNATVASNGGAGIRSSFGDADLVANVTADGNAVAYDSTDGTPRYGLIADGFRLASGVVASFGTNVSSYDDADAVPELPAETAVAGPAANLTTDGGNGPADATMTFPTDVNATDGTGLEVWRFDDGEWRALPNESVNADGGTVTVTVRRGGVVVPVVTDDRAADTGGTSSNAVGMPTDVLETPCDGAAVRSALPAR